MDSHSKTQSQDGVRRGSIVLAAASLFSDAGYRAVSMDDIAAKVGLAKSSLYYYVKRKADFISLMNSECNELIVKLEKDVNMGIPDVAIIRNAYFERMRLNRLRPGYFLVCYSNQANLPKGVAVITFAARAQYSKVLQGVFDRFLKEVSLNRTNRVGSSIPQDHSAAYQFGLQQPARESSANIDEILFQAYLYEALMNPSSFPALSLLVTSEAG